ncbi:MAG: type II secretion system F family protein [Oscillospiraceae bacterium]|jgi:tight adherence protein C|nr:type II secretion system F family protein [Oscillospiraceae bacterium]
MKIILMVLLLLSSALIAAWFMLLFKSGRDDAVSAAYDRLLSNTLKIEKLRQADAVKAAALKQYTGVIYSFMKLISGSHEKEISKLESLNDALRGGNIGKAGIMTLPGHVLRRSFTFIGEGALYKTLQLRHIELYGKKNAEYKTNGVLAAMCSYAIIGVGLTLALGIWMTALEAGIIGPVILLVGTGLAVMLAYSLYDEPRAEAAKRREKIARQFPNVVSKLALLVCSGMIMDRAWNETADSHAGELYTEMKKTANELNQNIAPEAAYSNFIVRCNTKETSKLASAILQNLSKGNAEIGNLLRELAHEAWQERRHTAKRDAEKANSQLLIPTMLLFISILIMIAAPIAMMLSGAML